jgi:hypothetical protein
MIRAFRISFRTNSMVQEEVGRDVWAEKMFDGLRTPGPVKDAESQLVVEREMYAGKKKSDGNNLGRVDETPLRLIKPHSSTR